MEIEDLQRNESYIKNLNEDEKKIFNKLHVNNNNDNEKQVYKKINNKLPCYYWFFAHPTGGGQNFIVFNC